MSELSFYLAHPFDSRGYVRKWELEFEKKFDINLINPFYDTDQSEIMKEMDSGEREKHDFSMKYVEKDIGLILKSDGLVGIIDRNKTIGTIMEIVYSYMFGKLTYLIAKGEEINHPFLKYHANRLFSDTETFERFIKNNLIDKYRLRR